jgi:hypothetical protein
VASLERAYARVKKPRSRGELIDTLSKSWEALPKAIAELRDLAPDG